MFGPNRIRHLAATEIKRHFDADTARIILGHQDPRMTDTYNLGEYRGVGFNPLDMDCNSCRYLCFVRGERTRDESGMNARRTED
jgi:hypothetical protein